MTGSCLILRNPESGYWFNLGLLVTQTVICAQADNLRYNSRFQLLAV